MIPSSKVRGSETGYIHTWRRRATAGAVTVILAGCAGESAPDEASEATSPAPTGTSSYVRPLPFPGKIHLETGFPDWSHKERGQAFLAQVGGVTRLLTVIDGRMSAESNPDPEADWGAGPQEGASVEAPQTNLPDDSAYHRVHDGNDYFRNGTVVEIVTYTPQGQLACHANGQNDTRLWLEVRADSDDPSGWVASTLLSPEYQPGLAQLAAAGIKEDFSQSRFSQTAQGGC
jgi:hypothetical protein